MTTRKIFFAMPSRLSVPKLETTASLLAEMDLILRHGWSWTMRCRVGDSYPHRVRNLLAAMFFETDCTDIVWIDDDVSWNRGDLVRLINHPVDFVAATYRVKDDSHVRYPLRWIDDDLRNRKRDPQTGLIEVAAVPFGFVRITREAMERFRDTRADMWFMDAGQKAWNLFDIVLKYGDPGGYSGEDYVFCERFREAGGKVWLDPDISIGHTGEKTFFGRVSDELNALDAPSLDDKMRVALGEAA